MFVSLATFSPDIEKGAGCPVFPVSLRGLPIEQFNYQTWRVQVLQHAFQGQNGVLPPHGLSTSSEGTLTLSVAIRPWLHLAPNSPQRHSKAEAPPGDGEGVAGMDLDDLWIPRPTN